jgi:hypothetical protein
MFSYNERTQECKRYGLTKFGSDDPMPSENVRGYKKDVLIGYPRINQFVANNNGTTNTTMIKRKTDTTKPDINACISDCKTDPTCHAFQYRTNSSSSGVNCVKYEFKDYGMGNIRYGLKNGTEIGQAAVQSTSSGPGTGGPSGSAISTTSGDCPVTGTRSIILGRFDSQNDRLIKYTKNDVRKTGTTNETIEEYTIETPTISWKTCGAWSPNGPFISDLRFVYNDYVVGEDFETSMRDGYQNNQFKFIKLKEVQGQTLPSVNTVVYKTFDPTNTNEASTTTGGIREAMVRGQNKKYQMWLVYGYGSRAAENRVVSPKMVYTYGLRDLRVDGTLAIRTASTNRFDRDNLTFQTEGISVPDGINRVEWAVQTTATQPDNLGGNMSSTGPGIQLSGFQLSKAGYRGEKLNLKLTFIKNPTDADSWNSVDKTVIFATDVGVENVTGAVPILDSGRTGIDGGASPLVRILHKDLVGYKTFALDTAGNEIANTKLDGMMTLAAKATSGSTAINFSDVRFKTAIPSSTSFGGVGIEIGVIDTTTSVTYTNNSPKIIKIMSPSIQMGTIETRPDGQIRIPYTVPQDTIPPLNASNTTHEIKLKYKTIASAAAFATYNVNAPDKTGELPATTNLPTEYFASTRSIISTSLPRQAGYYAVWLELKLIGGNVIYTTPVQKISKTGVSASDFVNVGGRDIDGMDLGSVFEDVSDAAACASKCADDEACVASVYDPVGRDCWLKSEFVNDYAWSARQTYVRGSYDLRNYKWLGDGTSNVITADDASKNTMLSRAARGMPTTTPTYVGSDPRLVRNYYANACAKICSTTSGCVGFTLNQNRTCDLYSRATGTGTSSGAFSYVKQAQYDAIIASQAAAAPAAAPTGTAATATAAAQTSSSTPAAALNATTIYNIVPRRLTTQSIHIFKGDFPDGTTVVTYGKGDGSGYNTRWKCYSAGNNQWFIRNENSNRNLSMDPNGSVMMRDINSSNPNQRWSYDTTTRFLTNVGTGRYLVAESGAPNDRPISGRTPSDSIGNYIYEWTFETAPNRLLTDSTQFFKIQNAYQGKCLYEAIGSGGDDDTRMWGCDYTPNSVYNRRTTWRYNTTTKQIINQETQRCLGSQNRDSTNVNWGEACDVNKASQRWTYDPYAQSFKEEATGKCLMARAWGDGGGVNVGTCNDSMEQKWKPI